MRDEGQIKARLVRETRTRDSKAMFPACVSSPHQFGRRRRRYTATMYGLIVLFIVGVTAITLMSDAKDKELVQSLLGLIVQVGLGVTRFARSPRPPLLACFRGCMVLCCFVTSDGCMVANIIPPCVQAHIAQVNGVAAGGVVAAGAAAMAGAARRARREL